MSKENSVAAAAAGEVKQEQPTTTETPSQETKTTETAPEEVSVDSIYQELLAKSKPVETPTEEKQETDPKAEEKKDPPKTEEEKQVDKKLAPKFAALDKREAKVRELEKSLDEKVKGLESREAAAVAKAKQLDDFWEAFKKNPGQALIDNGIDAQDFVQSLALGKEVPAKAKPVNEEELEAKILAKIKAKQDEENKEKTESQKQKEEASIKAYKANVQKFLNEKKDDFELLHLMLGDAAKDEIYEYARIKYERDGEDVSFEEAAKVLEAHLEGNLTKSKKFATKVAKSDTQATTTPSNTKPVEESKTLTGNANAGGTRNDREETYDELVNRIAAELKTQSK